MKKEKVAFIGLGAMGYVMAGHLTQKGYSVVVYNRTLQKAQKWAQQYNGIVASSPADAARSADIVCICVGNDDDIRNVVYEGSGILETINDDTILIDHTTASAKIARELGALAQEKNFHFLDAPVTGGVEGAKNGMLSIMVGGEEKIFEKMLPVMHSYGKAVTHMGVHGNGQLTKMANQICLAASLQGVAEAYNFSLNAGLDMDKAFSVLSHGSAQSWQLENRGPWMLNEEYKNGGFVVDLINKDLGIAIEEAQVNGSRLPVVKKIKIFLQTLQKNGKGKWDFSAIFTLLR